MGSRDLPVSGFPGLDLERHTTVPHLYVGDGELNSGPHTFNTNTLPNESIPSPSRISLKAGRAYTIVIPELRTLRRIEGWRQLSG